MKTILSDVRYALRQLRKAPGFSVTAIVTLGLGIGISAAMFAVVDGVLLRPLPVPHPSEIVALGQADNSGNISSSSLPNLQDWRARSKSFQGIAWYTQSFFDMKKADGTEQFSLDTETSPNFFSMLQAQPLMGRTFLPRTGVEGNLGSVVLSYSAWKNNFHADPKIVGKTVDLGTDPYTVIGVMPRLFYIPINDNGPLVWTVLRHAPAMEERDNGMLQAIGRLRPGVSVAAARTELSGIQSNIARAYPEQHLAKSVAVLGYKETLVGPIRSGLFALLSAVLLVWLIACANIAGLLLTRMSLRRREVAMRSALGASRGRIVSQFLTESLLIGGAGGLLGLGIAYGCFRFLHRMLEANLSRSANIGLNWHAILLLIALSIFSAVIFGTLPALQAASANPQDALHEGSRAAGIGARQLKLRNALIVGELALSLVLLVSAGLLLRTLYALREVHLGFNPQHLVVAQLLKKGGFVSAVTGPNQTDIRDTFYKPLLERVRQLPGVESAAMVTAAPLTGNIHMGDTFAVIGDPAANTANRSAEIRAVTPGAYRTLGIPLLQGRLFNQQDRPGTRAVAVVNQAFAQQYLGTDPIGKRLDLDLVPKSHTVLKDTLVIGVVADTPQSTPGKQAEPEIDVDVNQIPVGDDFYPILTFTSELAVRTALPPRALVPTISRILAQMNSGFVINSVQTMDEHIDDLLGSQTLAARLLWIFAGAALLIAAAGLYGLLSYNVSLRTREIGTRIALGAERGDILRMVLVQAARLVGIGILLGVPGAYFATTLIRSFLYGVGAHNVPTFLAVAVMLTVVALVAAYLPARRAAQTEPMEALRTE